MLGKCLEQLRCRAPLIHNITNYVTINDVANVLYACGGKPIMSDEPEDAAEVTAVCDGLNLNMGMLNQRKVPGMLAAGVKANALGHPVVLDPVGIGATEFRRKTAKKLLSNITFTAVRGNLSEIEFLIRGKGTERGVDSDRPIPEQSLDDMVHFVKDGARSLNCIVAVTGTVDVVSDGKRCYLIRNGRREMRDITGTGCMLSGMTAAFLAANPDRKLEAVAASVCTMGLAGEIAWGYMQEGDGNATYRNRIIDAIYQMNGETLEKGADYELR